MEEGKNNFPPIFPPLKNRAEELKEDEAEFFRGEYDALAEVFRKVAPSGKAALFFSRENYLGRGQILVEKLKRAGCRPISVISDGDATLQSAAGINNLPEDVRIALAADTYSLNDARYFAAVRNIPVSVFAEELNFGLPIGGRAIIGMGGGTDTFGVNVKTYAVISPRVALDVKNLAARIASALPAALDDLIAGRAEGKENSFAREILSAAERAANSRGNGEVYAECAILCELINARSGGRLFFRSAAHNAAAIFARSHKVNSETLFFAAEKTMEIYRGYYSGKPPEWEIAEPRDEAAFLFSRGKIGAAETMSEVYRTLINKRDDIIRAAEASKEEAKSAEKLFGILKSEYRARGGRKTFSPKGMKNAVISSGDSPFAPNFITLLRII